jgi:hypothetical protein
MNLFIGDRCDLKMEDWTADTFWEGERRRGRREGERERERVVGRKAGRGESQGYPLYC